MGCDAIVAATPVIALRAYHAARALGILVPHAMALASLRTDPAVRALGIAAIEQRLSVAVDVVVAAIVGGIAGRPGGVEMRLPSLYVPGVTSPRVVSSTAT